MSGDLRGYSKCQACHPGATSAEIAAGGHALNAINEEAPHAGIIVTTQMLAGIGDAGGDATALIEEGVEEGATSARVCQISCALPEDVTRKGSTYPNFAINLTENEFVYNLEQSGYVASLTKDGKVLMMTNGSRQFAVRGFSESGPPTAEYKVGGQIIMKIRLIR